MSASVIITTYKRPLFLRRAVESVLTQTILAEVIVVDDNGLGTPMQLETKSILSDLLDRIVYLPLQENRGACIARNLGAERGKGEYLFFLDDDDEFLPDKVEVQSSFLDEHPQFDGCLSAFKRLQDNGEEVIAESNYPSVGNFNDFVVHGNFFTPMLAIRKSSFLKMGGFREIPRFQDRFFLLHCLKNGMQFQEIQEQLYIMYEHSGERVTHNSVTKSIHALDILKEFIDRYKADLAAADYKKFLQKDYRMRATIYYVSKNNPIKSAFFWMKTTLLSYQRSDFLLILKSFLNII
jgi:glycosyltransferase involved in cell wall biosynthesis